MRKLTTYLPVSLRSLDALWKLLLVVVFGWVVYRQRLAGQDMGAMYRQFQAGMQEAGMGWLLLCLALMPLNWLLESLKWQVFTRVFMTLSLWQHLRAVLSGVALSLVTPNRLGDYLGRILVVATPQKAQVLTATLAAGYVQLVVLLTTGWLGASYFLPVHAQLSLRAIWPIVLLGGGGTILLIFLLLQSRQLLLIVKKHPRIQRFPWVQHSISVSQQYGAVHLKEGVIWALFRYVVYSLQYYCMLRCVGVHVPVGEALAGVATVFLLQTSIPLPPALGLLARGEIALFVWGALAANELSILTASYGLFLINLLLPGLWGLSTIIRINLIKPNCHENKHVDIESDPMGAVPVDGTHHSRGQCP